MNKPTSPALLNTATRPTTQPAGSLRSSLQGSRRADSVSVQTRGVQSSMDKRTKLEPLPEAPKRFRFE